MKKTILEHPQYAADLQFVYRLSDFSALHRKKILITGGLGLIGSAVVDLLHTGNAFSDARTEIYVACRDEGRFLERYGGYPDIHFISYDAQKPISFAGQYDYLIHGAGPASPELYMERPVETMLANFCGVLDLLRFSKERAVRRLLYISSSEVYGEKQTPDPFREEEFGSVNINKIRSSYSEGKRAAELLCRSYVSEYGADTVIVRPGHIFGPTASEKDRRVASEFAYLAAKGQPLTLKSSGASRRSLCYCVDCAAAILTVLLKGETGEAYNVGHEESATIREMAEIYAEAGNVPLTAAEPADGEAEKFNPMNNATLNVEKINRLGFHNAFSIPEGLCHTVGILKDIL